MELKARLDEITERKYEKTGDKVHGLSLGALQSLESELIRGGGGWEGEQGGTRKIYQVEN